MWTAISDFAGLDEVAIVPEPFTFEQHADTAKEFRKHLENDCKRSVCVVCSSCRRNIDIKEYNIDKIPNLSLLGASVPKSTYPRDALTTFT